MREGSKPQFLQESTGKLILWDSDLRHLYAGQCQDEPDYDEEDSGDKVRVRPDDTTVCDLACGDVHGFSSHSCEQKE